MSKQKHTPGEWRRGSDDLGSPELFTEIYAPNGFLIATANSSHQRGKAGRDAVEYARANAARIVQCCNAHDELVAALASLVAQDEKERAEELNDYAKGSPMWKCWQAARAALTKATGDAS